jgi:RNA polymerase sigma factor (sigma-70 family)
MSPVTTRSVARQLGSLFDGSSVAGLTDRQLIERFNDRRDATGETAFGALVARHGPMVLHVCHQILGDQHHAEDAFQAVFLVLARKARSIRDPDLLGNWLYGVALRTGRKARVQLARRRKHEEGDAMRRPGSGPSVPVEPMVPSAEVPVLAREQAEVLHREIDRLPGPFRLPVVLCYLEGLTLDEAARRLRCPAGTVRSRLARACDKLRRGLTRRGVVLSATAFTTALSPRAASASVSSPLCNITTRAAMNFAAGQAAAGATSASAMALAQEVLRSMLFHKMKLIALTFLFLGAVATGAGYLNHSLAMKDEPKIPPANPQPPVVPKPADTKPKPAADRMTVTGRVLDPDGKPVKGAAVDVVTKARSVRVGASERDDDFTLLGQDETDGDGRFRLEVARTSSARVWGVVALGSARGFGFGQAELNPDAEQPEGDIRLQPEQVVRARLVDLSSMPARGVEVLLHQLPREIRALPRSAKTDDQGRFVLSGIGRDFPINLKIRDLRYARQDLYLPTGNPAASRDKEITFALEPARIIEGQVLAADTGKPIPHAVVSAETLVHNEHAHGFFDAKFRADAQGRFQMNPIPGEEYTLGAFPTGGEPYLIQQDKLKWIKGAVKANHDIKLKRGVIIRGKVTESGTGRPLAGSSIQFIPVRSDDTVLSGWQAIVPSQDDGSYQITVMPGKGHLLVFGPTPNYVLKEIGSNLLYDQGPGGDRTHGHDIIPYETKAGDPPHEVSPSLRPGVTIQGRVEGPDGQTVTDAYIFTTLHINATNPTWRGDNQVEVRDGRFELHGLAPEAPTRIHVLEPKHQWGATVEISGKPAGADLTIRLQPCGQARARFVGPDGKPIANHWPRFEFVMTPGPIRLSMKKSEQAELTADADFQVNVDHTNYMNNPLTDAQGRVTLPALIPGAFYRIIDHSTVNVPDKGAQIRKDFTVKPGETLDLGDILIEKPQAQ